MAIVMATAVVTPLLTLTPLGTALGLRTPSAQAATSLTFNYTGAAQSWTVPAGVHAVKVDAWGAQGDGTYGGFGGWTTATVPVAPGQVLQVNVGGRGVGHTGGFNGGGAGGWYPNDNNPGAGGGASDIRIGTYSLASRLVVAGGGGGEAPDGGSIWGLGGSGGQVAEAGWRGSGQWPGGGGASQSAGGAGNGAGGGSGGFGYGASGGNFAGAGGGGWYGGGAGGSDLYGGSSGGGGGGSSYVTQLSYDANFVSGARAGNGLVTLTFPPSASPPSSPSGSAAFAYTGGPQTWTVPAGVRSIRVDAIAARGDGASAGLGGETQATIRVVPGQMLVVMVGGRGVGHTGGFNGGASGGFYPNDTSPGAGGGASDVRLGGWLVTDRAVVAGGGGGAAPDAHAGYGSGGSGGGYTGGNGGRGDDRWLGGGGASQTAGGAGNGAGGGTGGFGFGATTNLAGGGGGGWYGGGGGGSDVYGGSAGGGGGGSGHVVSSATDVVMTGGVNSGDGSVAITYPAPLVSLIGGSLTAGERYGLTNAGERGIRPCKCADPVDPVSGNFSESMTDLQISGRGPALRAERTYNSLAAGTSGPLGNGWTFSYGASLAVAPDQSTVTVRQENGAEVTFALAGSTYSAAPRVVATLAHNADGTWAYSRAKRDFLTFDSAGRLLAERDLNGYSTNLTYTGGQLSQVTDASGRSLVLTWTGGRISDLADSSSPARTVHYAYDGSGNLVDVTDVGGGHTTFTYDAGHRLLTKRSPRFNPPVFTGPDPTPAPVVTNHYDTQGRVDSQTDPLGRTTNFDYSTAPGSTIVTDPQGHAVRLDFRDGLLVSESKGYGTSVAATWAYEIDPSTGAVSAVTDPDGNVVTSSYDDQANVIATVDAAGRATTYAYDALNDLTTVTSPLVIGSTPVTAAMTYDGTGNPLSRSQTLLGDQGQTVATQVTTMHYDDPAHPGDVTSIVDPLGKVWSFAYDAGGNRTSETDPLGDQATFAYNSIGWMTSSVSPNGNAAGADPNAFRATYDHDAFGAVTTVRSPLWRASNPTDHRTVTHYDADHNVDSTTDGNGNTAVNTFDAAGQIVDQLRPDGTHLATTYWADGRVKEQRDGAGAVTAYGYDAQGRLTSSTDPLTRTTTSFYDPAGRLVSSQQPGGDCSASPSSGCTTYSYDSMGDVVAVDYSDPATPDISFTGFDALGRRVAMNDGTGSQSWAWDSLGRLTRHVDGSGAATAYAWDLRGSLTGLTPSGFRGGVARGYDDAGRWTSVTGWQGDVTSFSYDRDGNLVGRSNPNGASTTYASDAQDRLMSVSHASTAAPASPFASFGYGRDGGDRLTSVSTAGLSDSHSYGYSALDQLASVDSAAYGYDAADNLTRLSDGTPQTYDNGNQLTTGAGGGVVFIGAANKSTQAPATPLQLTLPAGIQAGDQILVASTQDNAQQPLTPAGYQVAGSWTSAQNTKVVLFRKTADGSETSVSISYSSPASAAAAVAVVYRGLDPNAPLEQPAVGSQGSALAVTAPSVTARNGGRLVTIAAAAHHPVVAAFAAPAGMDVRADASGQPNAASALYDQPLSGSSGPRTVGFGQTTVGIPQSADLLAVNLGLRPQPAAYTYDQRGNRTTASSVLGVSTFGWDQANRLTSFTGGSASATYAYDGDGIRTSKTVGGLTKPMVWDHSGSLPMVLSDGDASYLYGPGGTPVEQNKPVPITAVGSSTASANATSLTVPLPSGVVAGDQIVLAMTHAASTPSSTPTGYTELVPAQLSYTRVFTRTATSAEAAPVITFGAKTQASAVMTVYRGVDAANPVVAASLGVGGSLATAPSVNADDGMVVLVGGGANGLLGPTSCSFTFPAGMTVRQTACAGGTARWATGTAMADQSIRGGPTGSKSVGYGTLVDETMAMQIALRSRRKMEYFHQDQLGSTRALTDAGGAVVATFSYDPYGRQTASAGSGTTPFGFAGEYTDAETGLQYLRARYYDPATAQFLSRDPLVSETGSAYAYAADDPLNRTDPSGLYCWGPFKDQKCKVRAVFRSLAKDAKALHEDYGKTKDAYDCLMKHNPHLGTCVNKFLEDTGLTRGSPVPAFIEGSLPEFAKAFGCGDMLSCTVRTMTSMSDFMQDLGQRGFTNVRCEGNGIITSDQGTWLGVGSGTPAYIPKDS